jgi:hypothetical protein
MFEALSASCCDCCCPSVVIIGFNSFFLFLFAFPLEALLATCFAFWIAACLIWDPFMVLFFFGGGGVGRTGKRVSCLCMTTGWVLRVVIAVPGRPQRRKAGGMRGGYSSTACEDDNCPKEGCDYDDGRDNFKRWSPQVLILLAQRMGSKGEKACCGGEKAPAGSIGGAQERVEKNVLRFRRWSESEPNLPRRWTFFEIELVQGLQFIHS